MMRHIALVGNPNVGKSTIFNALTGMHQKTGNWSGVTTAGAYGTFSIDSKSFSITDLPGIYSFDVRSAEEAVTRNYILNEDFDDLLLICDATCLERGLHLLKQVSLLLMGRGNHVRLAFCVNLCDEADKKGIHINFSVLEQTLKIPVIPCSAREKHGLDILRNFLSTSADTEIPIIHDPKELAAQSVTYTNKDFRRCEERLDHILTNPFSGTLIMLLMLTGVFWLTITGANYPSQLLWKVFFSLEPHFACLLSFFRVPPILADAAVYGIYRVIAWIVSVMLPPMAIFFPLFTLLEDFGYLPRAAFNMDGAFEKCGACGKQCLTMAMGLGCNAAGVTGCRIINSPRERLIAILTNSLVPCNGRFPLLIAMNTFAVAALSSGSCADFSFYSKVFQNLEASFLLTLFLLVGIASTLAVSRLLSHTLLKGVSSSFALELPPYRRPQIKKVLIRSIFDRTLFVLGRAVMVAAPAGLLIWCMANISFSGQSLFKWCSGFLDPIGFLMGLDGTILMAFVLGFPANEIVLPIILMAYLQTGHLTEMNDSAALFDLLAAHGWTFKTYFCMAVFSLFHWPCSTTCLTIKKETGSFKWTAAAFLIPTLIGIVGCVVCNLVL